MLGRSKPIKKAISLTLAIILTFNLSGCQNDSALKDVKLSSETYNDIIVEPNKTYRLELVGNNSKQFSALPKVPINDIFSSSKHFSYPDYINFIPTYLSEDNILYGEGDESENRSKLFLGSYNLDNGKFSKLAYLKAQSEYASIGIITASKSLIVYEESDQGNNISQYYIYDIKNRKTKKLYSISNIPALHYTQAFIATDGIMFNLYNPDTTGYINMFYCFDSDTLIEVERENCGFPIIYNNLWYYVKIDNKNATTQLIEFDLKNRNKKILYETVNQNEYISGLYSNGKKIFITFQKGQNTCFYEINFKTNKINYLFESEWIESIILNDKYVSWLGSNTLPERNRPQYYLYEIDTSIIFQNNGGPIFLSHNGIVWIEYKKDDKEIKKGEIYNNDNTSIVFKKI